MNDRDSEIIYGLLIERGWKGAESIEEADCVLFNTCSVRHHAEERAYSNMGMLAKLKKHRPNKDFAPGAMSHKFKCQPAG